METEPKNILKLNFGIRVLGTIAELYFRIKICEK